MVLLRAAKKALKKLKERRRKRKRAEAIVAAHAELVALARIDWRAAKKRLAAEFPQARLGAADDSDASSSTD